MKGKLSVAIVALVPIIMVTGLLLTGCTVITGSGILKTEVMDFSDFTSVEIGHAFEAEIVQSDQFSVSVTADDNLFEYIQVSRIGSTLKVSVRPAVLFNATTQLVEITMPRLLNVEFSGASRGTITGFESVDDMDIEVSGASWLELDGLMAGNMMFDISGASQVTGEVDADDVEFDVSGASTVRVQGAGDNMELDLSGASNAELDDFPLSDADVNLSGASQAIVNVSGRLDVNLSGASKLTYTGNPTLGDVDISGASTIQNK